MKIIAAKEEIKTLSTKAESKQSKMKWQNLGLKSFYWSNVLYYNDTSQSYLILQPLYYNLKRQGNTEKNVL